MQISVNYGEYQMEQAARRYKEIYSQIEVLEKERESLKEVLLKLNGDREHEVHGLSFKLIIPSPTIDLKKLVDHYKFVDDELEQFRVEKSPYWRMAIKRNIVV